MTQNKFVEYAKYMTASVTVLVGIVLLGATYVTWQRTMIFSAIASSICFAIVSLVLLCTVRMAI